MTILALDTTSDVGSVAVLRDGIVVANEAMQSSDGLSTVLFHHITRALELTQCTLSDVDLFAAASGPGSFTGVRIGMTAIKGLAEATGKPAAAISNLRALAAAGTERLRAVAVDARRGEVYAALYDANLNLVGEETVGPIDAWLAQLPDESFEFITSGAAPVLALLNMDSARSAKCTVTPIELAAAVALCASLDASAGRLLDPAAIDANYVRTSDAKLNWHDRWNG